jgi:drug/metabolite transporter (DMT)-like permease
MTRKDGLLALLVVVVWGLNFVVIKVGLHNMPPLMLAGLRFLLVAFPALLFVARPKIPLRLLLGYGLTISFGQFAFYSAQLILGCPLAWPLWCCRRRRSSPLFLALLPSVNACRENSWPGLRWLFLASWCWWKPASAASMFRSSDLC